MVVRPFRSSLLFSFALASFQLSSRRIFKICAFAHQLYMHERNKKRARENIGKRNKTRGERLFNESFGLCKHLPKGVVYVCNDNRHTLMCLFLSFTLFIWVSLVFFVNREQISSPHLLVISSTKSRKNKCDDTFSYIIVKRKRIEFNSWLVFLYFNCHIMD
jgi:hypothetical protein